VLPFCNPTPIIEIRALPGVIRSSGLRGELCYEKRLAALPTCFSVIGNAPVKNLTNLFFGVSLFGRFAADDDNLHMVGGAVDL